MTVVDHAGTAGACVVAVPTLERQSRTTATARQDARRRATIVLTDAAAACVTAAGVALAVDTLRLRSALLVPVAWTLGAWALGAYHQRRVKRRLVDVERLLLTAVVLWAGAGVVGTWIPFRDARSLVLVAVPATALAVGAARAALLPLVRPGRVLAAAPLVVVGPAAAVRGFLAAGAGTRTAATPPVAAALVTPDPVTAPPAGPPPHAPAGLPAEPPATPGGPVPVQNPAEAAHADRAVTAELAARGVRRIPSADDLVPAVRQAGADTVVVVGDVGPAALQDLAWRLEPLAVAVAVTPLWRVAPHRVGVRTLGAATVVEVSPPRYYGARLALREAADRVAAAVALVVLAPLLAAIAVGVKVGSPGGPVFYRQLRTGKGGRRFPLLKFRTMVPDADRLKATLAAANQYGDGTLFKVRSDPRVTPLGRWLRRYSLDELPQLVNVVRGDMLLVGPRPTSTPPEQMRGDYRRRTLVKPGLTGLWQVSGRSDLSWEESVALDLDYVENRSTGLDLDILLRRTPPAVLGRRGAYLSGPRPTVGASRRHRCRPGSPRCRAGDGRGTRPTMTPAVPHSGDPGGRRPHRLPQ